MITCPECGGSGEWDCGIECIPLKPGMPNYQELLELQTDAQRVIRQAKRLMELNPRHSDAYAKQLNGCLAEINKVAEKTAQRG
jgi:hypothetical protein